MKSADEKEVSRIWQFAHLKYYFGQKEAARGVIHGKLKLLVARESHTRREHDEIELNGLSEIGAEAEAMLHPVNKHFPVRAK